MSTRAVANAISLGAFRSTLDRLLNFDKFRQNGKPLKLGLAISGGVDSMALAYLCRQLEQQEPGLLTCHALVVDHRVRPESSKEAIGVRENLQQNLGIHDSRVLSLTSDSSPATIKARSNLESKLRRARFRTLGEACRQAGIEKLLLAHHADDQAETVMMRIIHHYVGDGLRGIQGSGDIPECYGMHGIHRSSNMSHAEESPTTFHRPRLSVPDHGLPISMGGIKIYRPLLDFSKAELQQTCLQAGVHWVEDATNKDPTLTLRNAVRYLQAERKLPEALQKDRLLQVCKHVEKVISQREEAAKQLNNEVRLGQVDTRTGSRIVGFPTRAISRLREVPDPILARWAQLLADPLTPHEDPSLHSFLTAAQKIKSNLERYENGQENLKSGIFTSAGLMWSFQAIESELILKIIRQPLNNRESPRQVVWMPAEEIDTSKQQASPEEEVELSFGTWYLWDRRFWIRVLSENATAVRMEALEQDAVDYLKSGLSRRDGFILKEELRVMLPGPDRSSIPILRSMASPSRAGIPSLGLRLGGSSHRTKQRWTWEIKYKQFAPD